MPAGIGGTGCGGAPNLTTRDPIYVPVTVTHDGRTWTQVGMRYKGNSSLMSASASGSGTIPFRLDFDRYEDENSAIRNQRFYGFQKLTFASNLSDDSQLRELLAVEVFRDRGVPAARAAFCRIYVDTGSGPEYWGLSTMIEDPADGAMLDAQFGGSRGSLYKPEGPGANWTLPFNPAGFGKKTNEREADFSDVESAAAALHAPRDDPSAWRAALEARFDVDLLAPDKVAALLADLRARTLPVTRCDIGDVDLLRDTVDVAVYYPVRGPSFGNRSDGRCVRDVPRILIVEDDARLARLLHSAPPITSSSLWSPASSWRASAACSGGWTDQ